MNLTVFFILLGFALVNLFGVGLWHYEYKKDKHKVEWHKDKNFWKWTFMLLLFGTAYIVLRFILFLKGLFGN